MLKKYRSFIAELQYFPVATLMLFFIYQYLVKNALASKFAFKIKFYFKAIKTIQHMLK